MIFQNVGKSLESILSEKHLFIKNTCRREANKEASLYSSNWDKYSPNGSLSNEESISQQSEWKPSNGSFSTFVVQEKSHPNCDETSKNIHRTSDKETLSDGGDLCECTEKNLGEIRGNFNTKENVKGKTNVEVINNSTENQLGKAQQKLSGLEKENSELKVTFQSVILWL